MTATAAATLTRRDIEEIVAVWQKRLRLSHWNIAVRWEMPVDPGYDAEIKISDDYEQASIRIQQQNIPTSEPPTRPFETWDRRYANYTIVHEFLHIFEKQTRRAAEAAAEAMSSNAYDVFWRWYEHGAENWIDRLALVLVEVGGVA